MNFISSQVHKKRRGVTLIELLLYVSLSAIILMVSSVFLTLLLRSRVKNQTIAEVGQQGIQIMQIMTQTIREAETINSPTAGSSSNTLSLTMPNSALSPTIFQLSEGEIIMQEGVNPVVTLTSSRLEATSLNFQNLTRVATPGNVRIEFTLNHNNPEGVNEYSATKTFINTSSLRRP